MNQREAVVQAMRDNGGYATLGELYKKALKVAGVSWETKTPFKSINRIVQNPKYFFRIRPGLWALLEAKDKLPPDLAEKPKPESEHTYYQGLLVELGNLRNTTHLCQGRTAVGCFWANLWVTWSRSTKSIRSAIPM
ncbi:MAG: hypothetical protein ACLQOO_14555 [Terriglobia bacterium]